MPVIQQTKAYRDWITTLRDRAGRAHITRRVERLAAGLSGDVRPVGGGISEMRVDFGTGYRVYFTRRGDLLVILLCGGDKGSRDRDIARAGVLAADSRE